MPFYNVGNNLFIFVFMPLESLRFNLKPPNAPNWFQGFLGWYTGLVFVCMAKMSDKNTLADHRDFI